MRGARGTATRLLDWFEHDHRDLPWRRTRDPYGIWVSEVMLQQTQVRTVIPYWERWVRELPDVAALAKAPEARVLKLWEGLGYYRRARNLQAAARVILERHGGVFPGDPEAVLALPGIGRYTAGAICSIAFGLPAPIVDGNVVRVLTRLHALAGDPGRNPLKDRLWAMAEGLVQAAAATGRSDACSHFNQGLMELGALVCTPKAPACDRCPLKEGCLARGAGGPEAFPEGAKRPAVTARHGIVFVLVAGGRYLVRQRAASAVNGGLWEFPNQEVPSGETPVDEVREAVLGGLGRGVAMESLGEVRHSITRYRYRQRVFRLALPSGGRVAGEWRTLPELHRLAFTSAHRRIVRGLGAGAAAG